MAVGAGTNCCLGDKPQGTATLTGLGEGAHLMSPTINLQTHVQEVCGLIEHEELQGAVLVGHSYGGMVITGVAQQVGSDRPSSTNSVR